MSVTSDTTMTGTLVGGMTGLPPGTYAIRVTNPEVPPCTGTMQAALVVVPNPTITSVAPPTGCAADAEITITGSGFHDPMTGTVDTAPLGMPTVVNDTTMTGTVPMLPLGTYPVTVTIPEGCSASLPNALTVSSSTSTLTSIIPTRGWNGIDNPVIGFGTGFAMGDELLLAGAGAGGVGLDLTNEVVDATGTRIDGFVPQGGMEGGPYDLVLRTADGCFATLPMAFTIVGAPSLTVTDVIPRYGWTGTKTPVSIRGTMFQSTPKAYLVIPSLDPKIVPLKSTAFVNDTSLTSVVPAGLPVGGPYDVAVINPDGGGGLKPIAFRVTMSPPPTIDNVTPAAGTTQDPTPITITECNFRDVATVEMVAQDGTTTMATVTAPPVCNGTIDCPDNTKQCTLMATVPTNPMAVAPYVVRVTNTDEMTYGEYSLFVVTQPSAKLVIGRAQQPRSTRLVEAMRALLDASTMRAVSCTSSAVIQARAAWCSTTSKQFRSTS
ncbi:MAG TPA: IPT/TIG domain-containing protein, partial [Polyangium sp.]|nr:IPT/TIG domain-containing protein [Polyangium sp.]